MAWQNARPWWAHHSRVFLLPDSSSSPTDPRIVSTVQIEEVSDSDGDESYVVLSDMYSYESSEESASSSSGFSYFVHLADVAWQQVGVAAVEQTIVYEDSVSSTSDAGTSISRRRAPKNVIEV